MEPADPVSLAEPPEQSAPEVLPTVPVPEPAHRKRRRGRTFGLRENLAPPVDRSVLLRQTGNLRSRLRHRGPPPTQTEPGTRCSFWSIPSGPQSSGPSGSPDSTQGGSWSDRDRTRNPRLEKNTHSDEEEDVTQTNEALINKGEATSETTRNMKIPVNNEISLMKILKQAHLVPQMPRRSRQSIKKPNKINRSISKSTNSGSKQSSAKCDPSVAARTDIRGYFKILTGDRDKTDCQRGKVSEGEGESD